MKKFTLWLLFAFVALVANAGNFSVYLKIDGTNVLETSTVKVHVWTPDKKITDWNNLPQVTEKDIVMDVDGAKYFKYSFSDNTTKYNFLFICDGKQSYDYYDATTDIVITYTGYNEGDKKFSYKASTTAPVEPASVYLRGDNYSWDNGTKLEYNPKDKTYVYTETNPANLASNFKIWIDGGWYRYASYEKFNLSENKNIRTYEQITTTSGDMQIKDTASFSSITIKVKKDGDVWKMQVEGTPTGGGGSEGEDHTVTMKGAAWDNWKSNFSFTKQGDGTYAYTFKGNDKAGLAQEFAFTIDGKDYSYRTDLEVNTGEAYVMETNQKEKNYKIPTAANYSDITLTVAFSNGTPSLKVTGTKDENHTVTMKGAAWSWSDNKFTFTKQGVGTYAYTFTGNDKAGLAQEFAFTIDGSDYSYRTDLEVNTGDAYVMETNQKEKNYKIPTAADYSDITLTVVFSNGTPSLKVTGTEVVVTYPDKVTIVGDMTDWAAKAYTIPHKGDGIYEGKLDTRTKNGQWRIYEEWDGNLESENSWGYDVDQEGNMLSGTFTKGMKGYANTTTPKLWLLTFNINTGAWSLEEDTSGIESIDNEGVKIVAGKGTITVSGATNVEVYTAGGALVSREAESHVAAGLYIVRTDNKVAKVIVR